MAFAVGECLRCSFFNQKLLLLFETAKEVNHDKNVECESQSRRR